MKRTIGISFQRLISFCNFSIARHLCCISANFPKKICFFHQSQLRSYIKVGLISYVLMRFPYHQNFLNQETLGNTLNRLTMCFQSVLRFMTVKRATCTGHILKKLYPIGKSSRIQSQKREHIQFSYSKYDLKKIFLVNIPNSDMR